MIQMLEETVSAHQSDAANLEAVMAERMRQLSDKVQTAFSHFCTTDHEFVTFDEPKVSLTHH